MLTTEARQAPPYGVRSELVDGVLVQRVNLPDLRVRDPDGWTYGLHGWRAHERRVAQLLRSLVSGWRPELVHYHTSRPFGEECLLTLHSLGLPIAGFLHESWLVCGRLMLLRSPQGEPCSGPGAIRCRICLYSHYDGSLRRAIPKLAWRLLRLGVYPSWRLHRRRRARRLIAGALAYSRYMQTVHQGQLGGEVVYVPLGLGEWCRSESTPARPRTPLRFGFVGGTQPNKGLSHVLEAASGLARRGLRFELHLWGPGLETVVAELPHRGLAQHARVRGLYAPHEIARVFSEIDVAVMATIVPEPFGRIPLEAAASGAPSIVPAVGGLVESVSDGTNGFLFRFRDRQDLERQMARVLEERGLFQRLARALQPPRRTEDAVGEIEAFYRKILTQRTRC